jgi:hypothetical protein
MTQANKVCSGLCHFILCFAVTMRRHQLSAAA